jgi:hypothetical protein
MLYPTELRAQEYQRCLSAGGNDERLHLMSRRNARARCGRASKGYPKGSFTSERSVQEGGVTVRKEPPTSHRKLFDVREPLHLN